MALVPAGSSESTAAPVSGTYTEAQITRAIEVSRSRGLSDSQIASSLRAAGVTDAQLTAAGLSTSAASRFTDCILHPIDCAAPLVAGANDTIRNVIIVVVIALIVAVAIWLTVIHVLNRV